MERNRGSFVESALLAAALGAIVASASAGCAASPTYRVPGLEVQRLANLPPAERNYDIRVVPHSAPLYPSRQLATSPPPPVIAPAPAPPVYYGPELEVVEEQPPIVVDEPRMCVDVTIPVGGGHPHGAPSPPGVSARPAPRARGGWVGTPVSGGGGLRGSPPAGAAPKMTGWRGSPVASWPRMSVPTRVSVPTSSGGTHFGGGGGHHGGGGSGADAALIAVIVVVAVVGLIVLAVMAAEASAKADQARKFDGWVDVNPSHPLLLHYINNFERKVPLNALQPSDAIGVQYAVLSPRDGDVLLKAPPPVVAGPAAPAAPPLAPAYMPAPPPSVPPAPPTASGQPTH